MNTKRILASSLLLSLSAFLPACGGSDGDKDDDAQHVTVKSALPRKTASTADSAEVKSVTRAQREFSAALFNELSDEFAGKNAAISALSIHEALGMTWAGAKGDTASQMARVLRFGDDTHAGLNSLSQALDGRKDVTINIANSFWSRPDKVWLDGYLDTLAEYYGAGVETLDFTGAPDESRKFINKWVAKKTNDRIKDLLPEGSITPDTAAVLTNAVYFKAPWEKAFEKSETRDAAFRLSDGSAVTVPFVSDSEASVLYAEGEGWQAAQKNFKGGQLSMLFILPSEGTDFGAFSRAMDADKFDSIVGALDFDYVQLSLPKFKFTTAASLKSHLSAMGMTAPFEMSADFTGMTDDRPLFIGEIFHKTFVALDEKEVEAAAATGVVVEDKAAAPAEKSFIADRPFLFAIRDIPTGAILFYGQVMNPAEE